MGEVGLKLQERTVAQVLNTRFSYELDPWRTMDVRDLLGVRFNFRREIVRRSGRERFLQIVPDLMKHEFRLETILRQI